MTVGKELDAYVSVVVRDSTGAAVRSGAFGPGDVVPAWLEKAIDNPDVWAPEPIVESTEEP